MRPGQMLAINAYWLATNLHWGALLLILMPSQIGAIAPQRKAELLGLIQGVGALLALVVPLVVGALSDRCTSRWGRRRPYLVAGTAINILGLLCLWVAGNQRNIPLYLLGYLIVQLGNNIASAPYSGLIPDLVPEAQRGEASGYMAAMTQMGTILGAVLSGILMDRGQLLASYALIAVSLALFLAITLLGVREKPLDLEPERIDGRTLLKSLWIDPRKHPDFAWVWITRALVTLGIWSVQPFIQYYLSDVIGVPNPEKMAGYLMGAILLGATATGFLGGRLSDRIGRKRVVYVANVLIALISVGFIFADSLPVAFTLGLLYGLGYGAYYSVDWALGCDVLPNRKDAAKDLAVWHVAMVLPQSIAPPLSGWLLANTGRTGIAGHYAHAGYAAIFSLAALFLLLGAALLRNVRGAR